MTKTFLLALSLLLSAAWVQAQNQYPQSGSSQASTQTSGQTTVRGCLQGSDGSYTLIADDGTTYQLQGDTSKLSKHVGHEVQITGSTASAEVASAPKAAGAQQPMFTVEHLKHISSTCKSANKE
jgi:hypothetical protein